MAIAITTVNIHIVDLFMRVFYVIDETLFLTINGKINTLL